MTGEDEALNGNPGGWRAVANDFQRAMFDERERAERLREALEGAEDFIERVEKWTGSDPDEADEVLAVVRAALSPREDA